MSKLETSAKKFRMALVNKNTDALNTLAKSWIKVWNDLRPQLDEITKKYWAAFRSGEKISPSWLFRQQRYTALIDQIEQQLMMLARDGATIINSEVIDAVAMAQEHAKQLTFDALGPVPRQVTSAGYAVSWNRLPIDATTQMVGYLSDGSPITKSLATYGVDTAAGIKNALTTGIAQGHNPRKIDSACRKAYGGGLNQYMTLCRTETLRAYRKTSLESYKANNHVVEKWIWHCAQTSTTCPACWSMHGTVHDLEDELEDHPNGKCARLPKTKTWQELYPDLDLSNVKETSINIPTGAELFDKLPDEKQLSILGRDRYQAYKSGKIKIEDIVGVRNSKSFGLSVKNKTNEELGI